MGRLFLINLDDGNIYSCKFCEAHLALTSDIVSRAFHCKNGKAYLIENVVNVTLGEKEDRMMMTGMHTVVDIFCVGCGNILGWRYEYAHEEDQQYKEGKYILDRFKVLGPGRRPYAIGLDAQLGGGSDDDDE
ncbi:hypothetical protein Leryth_003509 [Lithospermum erythrorhizon]|nr:hypothetical protein Leryth_003509 [Lithospermum erythrorhizon]